MVKAETRAADKGLRQSTEMRNVRAETLGPDGGPQTRKPGSGGAAGLADAGEYTQNLFRLKMVRPGTETGAGGGGPRDMVAAVGKPGAGALRVTRPAEQTVKGPSSTTALHKTPAENKNTRMDRGQDNGELGDMAQQYCTTLDTALVIFPRLRYDMANGAKTNTHVREGFRGPDLEILGASSWTLGGRIWAIDNGLGPAPAVPAYGPSMERAGTRVCGYAIKNSGLTVVR